MNRRTFFKLIPVLVAVPKILEADQSRDEADAERKALETLAGRHNPLNRRFKFHPIRFIEFEDYVRRKAKR